MPDRIEKSVSLKAPPDRVWEALTDYRQFGQWFRVALDGPFVEGREATGRITHPGYEHVVWRATVVTIEPKSRFAFTWRPYAIDQSVDYSAERPTLVEFRLAPEGEGTRLSLVESGFDAVPAHRRDEAFRMNDRGWAQQMDNIKAHVDG